MELVLYIAAAVLLAGALLLVATYGPLRASAAEAGERTSDWAAEFWRWLRSGR